MSQDNGTRPVAASSSSRRSCSTLCRITSSVPRPIAEFVLHPARDTGAYRRWALFARSMLPKIVEYGLGAEEEIRHSVEHDLREELLATTGLVPLSWLMIGQWAAVPAQ